MPLTTRQVLLVVVSACLYVATVRMVHDSGPKRHDQPGDTVEVDVPRTEAELETVLSLRMQGPLDGSFEHLTKVFFVNSAMYKGHTAFLLSDSKEVLATELEPAFGPGYQPTLRELFDTIALQTRSAWRYDGRRQEPRHSSSRAKNAIDDVTGWRFTRLDRPAPKPFDVDTPEDWTASDNGRWISYELPPSSAGRSGTVGIVMMGRHSLEPGDGVLDERRATAIRDDIALYTVRCVKEDVDRAELISANVGGYDALLFEDVLTTMPRLAPRVAFRQWTFLVGDRGYVIQSATPDEQDKHFRPAIESMVRSFRAAHEAP